MARKKLLSEGEVRQFMKLANLGALSENYFTNNPLGEQEEEELEMGAELEEPPLGDEEVGMEDEVDLEGGDGENEELLARVVQAVADELGVEVDVEGAGAEGGEEEVGMEDELEEPLPGGGELEMGMGAEEEEEIPGNRAMYEGTTKGEETEEGTEAYGSPTKGEKLKKGSGKRGSKPGDKAYVNEDAQQLNEIAGLAAVVAALTSAGLDGALAAALGKMALAASVGGAGLAAAASRDPGLSPEAQAIAAGEEEEAGMAAGLDENEIVAEVARRVAERLQHNKKEEKVAAKLAERIFKRLTAKN